MLKQVIEGKKDLEKRPSLRLQCWNATRWLGRSECLMSLCRGYEYILEHLTDFAASKDESAKDKELATKLYEKLTSYDAFLFIYMYRDLAGTMARTSKLLQAKDIQIRDVGRVILNVCGKLKTRYPEDSDRITPLLGLDGTMDTILKELFGSNGSLSLTMI